MKQPRRPASPPQRPQRPRAATTMGLWTTEQLWAYLRDLERYADWIERELRNPTPRQAALFAEEEPDAA